jgi:ABC-2 type transport system ATP-binding protein
VTFAHPPPADAFELPGVQVLHREGNTVRLRVREDIDSAIKAIARYEVVDLRTEQPSLEEIFLAYYSDGTPSPQPVEQREALRT